MVIYVEAMHAVSERATKSPDNIILISFLRGRELWDFEIIMRSYINSHSNAPITIYSCVCTHETTYEEVSF